MSWLGLNTSVTGMFTSQRKLYTVNHNVSNADREGYSRQVVNTSANVPLHIPGQGYIGTGIGIDSVERVRDQYLDKKFRTESGSLGLWDAKNHALDQIEGVLRGGKEEGININMNELYDAIEDLSKDPSDMSHRTAFRERAVAVTKTLNESSQRLYKQQKDLNFEVKTKIKQVNDYAEQIRSINSQIFAMEVDGSSANDLRDQRDLIVDKLSKIVDIEAEERVVNIEETKDGKSIPIKKYEVRIGSISLVDHDQASKLKYPPAEKKNTLNEEVPLYQVEWANGGEVKLKGGELKGLLEVRDGGYEGAESNGIPYYIERLDEFARVFSEKFNEIHASGTNLNGQTGVNLFEADGEELRAYNIKVSDDILSDLNNIATIDKGSDDIENNKIMKKLLETRENRTFFGKDEAYQGRPEDYLTSILSTLGTDNHQASRMKTVEELIVKGATNQRLSVSGVDVDEEMAIMVKQQHIFNASARMVSTFDQLFDTIVNRLGMVGR